MSSEVLPVAGVVAGTLCGSHADGVSGAIVGAEALGQIRTMQVPRGRYAALLAGVSGAGVCVGALSGLVLGGENGGRIAGASAAVLAVASVLGFAPAVVSISAQFWGICVLLSGVARNLAVLGIAFAMQASDAVLATRAFHLSAGAGALCVLIGETVIAVRLIGEMDRVRMAGRLEREAGAAEPTGAHASAQGGRGTAESAVEGNGRAGS